MSRALRRRDRFPSDQLPDRLTPVFGVEGLDCLMETPKLAAVHLRTLKTPVISLGERQACITAALDFLFHGY